MVRFLIRMDESQDWVLHHITRAWSKVTGRSNFVLARWSMKLGLCLIPLGYLWDFYNERDGWTAFQLLIIAPLWMMFGVKRLRFFAEVEREVERGSETLNLNLREMQSMAIDRLFFTVWLPMLIPGIITGRLVSIGFGLYIVSNYFVMHFDCKGGKSVVKRMVEALRKAASKVAEKARDLVPSPQPIPVPIGA